VKTSWNSLILFLPFLLIRLRLPSPELDAVLFLLDYSSLLRLLCSYLYRPAKHYLKPLCTDSTENTVFYCQCVFTGPLPSSGRPIVGRITSWECVYRPVAQQWVYTSEYH
jgi:hypothetical protein